jgi:hypothetical protein
MCSKIKWSNRLKFISLSIISVCLTGCVVHIPIKQMPSNSEIIVMSKPSIDCPKGQMKVIHRMNNLLLDSRRWTLSCNEIQYECEMNDEEAAICTKD